MSLIHSEVDIMVRVLINGGAGKMGRSITELAGNYDNFEVVYSVDNKEGFQKIDSVDSSEVDVVIDISSPEGFRKIVEWSVNNGVSLVSGTTGLSESDYDLIESASKKIPILHTSNLSRGVNILFDVLKKAAALTGDADVEIIEIHHNRKKDAPSGTALELGRIISQEQKMKNLKPVHGREGITGEREFSEIGYHSVRCGDVPGEHTVIFAFEGERIEISHRARTRDIFARGAINAAIFLSDRQKGKYSMKDVICK